MYRLHLMGLLCGAVACGSAAQPLPGDGGVIRDGFLAGSGGAAPYDVVGVIGTGQSLGVGFESTAISKTQPFANLMLRDEGPDPKYPTAPSTTAKWSAVPLVEPIRLPDPAASTAEYPNNIFANGETPHSAMANTLSGLWRSRGSDYVTAHTVVGVGGMPITGISKGKPGYLAALNETRVWKQLVTASGKTYGVAGILFTHGESDATNPTYEAGVYQLWSDYNTDLKAVTGQTADVVMFASQQSSLAPGADGSQVQLWRAGVDHPGQIICTGPKYQYGAYGLHMPAPSYARLGEKYAEVFDLVINQKADWKPLGPNQITRAGAVITVALDVPNPPLVWDSHLIAPHQALHTAWAKGNGFEVSNDAGLELEIASAEIQGETVVLKLANDPGAAAKLTVGYAITQDTTDPFQGGTDVGPHGLLRDSDEFVGGDLETLDVQVTNGSPSLGGTQSDLERRAPHDLVSGTGISPDTILSDAKPWELTLSRPWGGATGTAKLTFRHDLRNYCVHFSMALN